MTKSTAYFSFHHPQKFYPKDEDWKEKEKNKELFKENARSKYVPALEEILKTIKTQPDFKTGLAFSGQFLKQSQEYSPEIIERIQEINENGENRVELITRPYHNTLSMFFGDKEEFIEQVSLQRSLLRNYFDVESNSFKPVSRVFNSQLEEQTENMGMKFIYADLPQQNSSQLYRTEKGAIIIPRNRQASGKFMSSNPENLAREISQLETCNLGIPINKIESQEFGEYLKKFVQSSSSLGINFLSPQELKTPEKQLESISYKDISRCGSWEEAREMTGEVIRSEVEFEFAKQLESMYSHAETIGNGQLEKWREVANLDTFDSFHTPEETGFKDEKSAVFYLTRRIDKLDSSLMESINIIDRKRRPNIIYITPEISEIPREYGEIAQNVKSGVAGLGIFSTNLVRGLRNQGMNLHIVSPNMPEKFKKESGKSIDDLTAEMFHIPHGNVHLVNSPVFTNKENPYEGSSEENILAFNYAIKEQQTIEKIRNKSEGPVIIHGNDNMPAPTIMRMATINDLLIQRGEKPMPLLHTVHNVHTSKLNPETLMGLGISPEKIYFNGNKADTQTSAIMDSWITNTVSETWLKEIIERTYEDVIPQELHEQVAAKNEYGLARAILNCPAPEVYPENIGFLNSPKENFPGLENLVSGFGPESKNLLEIKRNNLIAFQKYSGLEENPDAILAIYCARIDDFQKGCQFIMDHAYNLAEKHQSSKNPLQIAIVGNPSGNNPRLSHNSLVNTALASNGKITYQNFSKKVEALSHAGASMVFGPSRFEPCGQNDQIGLLYGAFGTFTDTGGYHDKIGPLRLASQGATHDHGNGFLHPYSSEGFREGIQQAYSVISRMAKNPQELEANQRRIMKEARDKFSIEKMSGKYVALYKELAEKVLE